jgi:hypothetical protein
MHFAQRLTRRAHRLSWVISYNEIIFNASCRSEEDGALTDPVLLPTEPPNAGAPLSGVCADQFICFLIFDVRFLMWIYNFQSSKLLGLLLFGGASNDPSSPVELLRLAS